jgi:molybdopterin converting factor small subunit
MKITVVYTTQLKDELGMAIESLDVAPSCSIVELVSQLALRHPDVFRKLVVDASDRLLPSIFLCVGDQQVAFDESVELSDGDTLTFLSAISGG